MATEILVARESFSTTLKDGSPFEVQAGVTHIVKGGSELKPYEHLFEPVRTVLDTKPKKETVEQATARPGEKRKR